MKDRRSLIFERKTRLKATAFAGIVLVLCAGLLLVGCEDVLPAQLQSVLGMSDGEMEYNPISVSAPSGPASGRENVELTYTFGVNTSLEGEFSYGFDWGDGEFTWTTVARAAHAWKESGTYTIKVQARCGDIASEWSDVRVVMIGTAKISRSPLTTPRQAMRFITPDEPEIKATVDSLLSGSWRRSFSDFDALREWVAKQVTYKRDIDQYGVADYWQFPLETIVSKTGDCEDVAILFCTLMRAYGVPATQVYVAIGGIEGTQSYHAYIFERYSRGMWMVIEPQIDSATAMLSLNLLDWASTHEYSADMYCFNDMYYFNGPPKLASGVYEEVAQFSLWPIMPAATVEYERIFADGEYMEGSVELLGDDRIVFGWELNIYGPDDDIELSWSGNDPVHEFTLNVTRPGSYRLEILKRASISRGVRVRVRPGDWQAVTTR
jgi:predicted transglutaminase-like cysteine proteinase